MAQGAGPFSRFLDIGLIRRAFCGDWQVYSPHVSRSGRELPGSAGLQCDGHAFRRERPTDEVLQSGEGCLAGAEDAPFIGLPSGVIQVAYRRAFPRDLDDRLADAGLGERDEPPRGPGAAIWSSAFGGAKSFNGFIKVLSVTGDRFSCR